MSRPALAVLEERYAGSPEELVRCLGETFRIPAIRLGALRTATPAFDVIPFVEAQRRRCIVVREEGEPLRAVLGDPYDAALRDWLEERVREPFEYRVAHPKELGAYLANQEEALRAMDGLGLPGVGATPARDKVQDISIQSIDESDSPVVRLVNSTLYDAFKAGASDVHLESTGAGLCIRYRIDGVLGPVRSVDGLEFAEEAISRIKVMSELDIAERRVPQDGRFRARSRDREIDFRVSIMPSVFGEDAVLRLLDKRPLADPAKGPTLEQLGFAPAIMRNLRRLARQPYGMLLVTGPTGSGKTTSLYSLISEVNQGLDKIITIEDPVEYQLPGVLQIPVNERKGLTFARGLRSILRHDPDRIMVGEIRDAETAEIAVQSALTGHLVYTTVHANNVFDVIGRFQHMGVDPFNLASALIAVMAQRLVRVCCVSCAGAGCGECRGGGFRGRKAIAELMIMNAELKELVAQHAPARRLQESARAAGTGSLREAVLELVQRGETTMEEADRVTYVEG